MKTVITPFYFKSKIALRSWFEQNHNKLNEVYIGIFKKHTNKATVVRDEIIEVAICFGWVDSRVHRIDDDSYCYRLTPRKKNSNWTESNIKLVEKFKKEGKMNQAGLTIFEDRKSKFK